MLQCVVLSWPLQSKRDLHWPAGSNTDTKIVELFVVNDKLQVFIAFWWRHWTLSYQHLARLNCARQCADDGTFCVSFQLACFHFGIVDATVWVVWVVFEMPYRISVFSFAINAPILNNEITCSSSKVMRAFALEINSVVGIIFKILAVHVVQTHRYKYRCF